jgi:hypothetical protein
MVNPDKRNHLNETPMKFFSMIKEKSFEEISAIGKNLAIQSVIAAGANIPNIPPFFPVPEKNINLPNIT